MTTSYPKDDGDAKGHFVKAEVDALRAQGHRVTVLAAGTTRLLDADSLGGDEVFDVPGALPRLARAPHRVFHLWKPSRALIRFSRAQHHFDRIVCHWLLPTGFPWGLWLKPDTATKEVVVHGSDLQLFLCFPAPLRTLIMRTLKRRGFHLRFVSHRLRMELERTALPPDLWKYVGTATVALPALTIGGAPTRAEARALLGLSEEERWAVFVGRLIEPKRPYVALSAADLVPDLKVAVVGAGPLEHGLRSAFPHFRFEGQVPRQLALTWIAAADLLIAPSKREGAPTAIREARALGTSVVTAPSGDTVVWARSDDGIWVV